MNTKRGLWTAVFLAAVVVLCVAGTKLSRITRTTTIQGDSLFLVVTGSQAAGTLQSRSIEASNLLSALTNFPGWPIGGSGGSATNVDVRTNANQFGAAGVTLTLKDGIQVTNPVVAGGITSTGGVARGSGAIDLQMARSSTANVASGAWSALLGGSNNQAKGDWSFAGGQGARANDRYSFAWGWNPLASNFHAVTFGWDNFNYDQLATILNGTDNVIGNYGDVGTESEFAQILGGSANIISNAPYSTILGSFQSMSLGLQSFVLGGQDHTVSNQLSGSIGGTANRSYGESGLTIGSYNTNWAIGAHLIGWHQTNNTPYRILLGFRQKSLIVDSNGTVTVFSNIISGGNATIGGGVSVTGDIVGSGDMALTTGTGTFDGVTVNSDLSLAYPTFSKALMIDAAGKVTSVTGVGAYVKADGTTGDPSGSASTNLTTLASGSITVGTVIASNIVRSGQVDVLTNLNANTVQITNALTVGTTNVITALAGKQAASMVLSNISGLASTVFTNVPLGGTNTSVRTAGGTNFIDTTGQLNNWALFPTNTMNSNALNAVLSFASNQVVVSAGANITVTPSGSGNVMTYTVAGSAGGGGGTNYPPALLSGTNITVGSGVRKNVTIKTNASFGVNFQGTPLNGETVMLTVSNYSASVIYWTNFRSGTLTTAFDVYGATNVSVFPILAGSQSTYHFEFNTNAVAGTFRQELRWKSGADYEARPGFNGLFETNGLVLFIGAATNMTINSARFHGGITNSGTLTQSGVSTFTEQVHVDTERIFASVGVNTAEVIATNNVSVGKTNFVGTLALPNVATNSILMTGGGSNAVAATVGPSLTFSGGVLAAGSVLTNLTGTVANNVTNENSTALQINTGTLTLSPGVISNLVASTIDVSPGNIITNVIAQKWNIWTNYVQTASNFVFAFTTNRYELKNQTNVIFTNIVEEATAVGADMAVHVHNTTGVTMGLVWPSYGAQHGYFFQTNINNPILTTTTLTTGKHGVASFTAFGTNIFATWTEWP